MNNVILCVEYLHGFIPVMTSPQHNRNIPNQKLALLYNIQRNMSPDESPANSIKRRLRSAGEAYAEHTLETVRKASKGLGNAHAAYFYPLQVSSVSPFAHRF